MSAGTAYGKRYAGGFVDLPSKTTPIDQQFLNAVEAAILQLIGTAPTADGQVAQWDNVNTRYGPALLLNKNIDPNAAIAKSKLDFTGANGIVNADVAGAAAIARSKLNFGAGLVDADIAAAAAIAVSKLAAPYTTYTPTLTGNTGGSATLGNASPVVARYLQIGKMVHCYGLITQGTTTNYGTGTLLVALPVTAANNTCQGCGTAFHGATLAQYLTSVSLVDATHFQMLIPNGYGGASAAINGSTNYPWGWAAGDNFTWNITYEAA